MAATGTEAFPALNGPVLRSQNGIKTRGRRKSGGGLGGLPGDSDVAALGTLSANSPPTTPTSDTSRMSSTEKPARRSKRRTLRRAVSKLKRQCLRHTWLGPLILMLSIISMYLVYPYPSNPMSAALFLSYPLPREPGSDPSAPILYDKGPRDVFFFVFYVIVLSFTREFIMQRLIKPIAISYGIKSRAKQARFMEQFYTAVYFSVFGPYGLWVMSRTPVWYFNTTAMWDGFPHKTHEAAFKAYYLLQAAYWAQQGIVLALMLEKPRKDFKELVAHHFITLALIWLSYKFHFTYIGIAIYITHDISDFFLATSKVINYVDSPIVGPYFFIFMCAWGYLRHYLNLKILYSVITEMATVGPFELDWAGEQYKCRLAQVIAFTLLSSLQAVNMYWWYLICKIAYRFIVSPELADDDRSEYEESELDEDGKLVKEKSNGVSNGTPKLLVNGEAPSTPGWEEKTDTPGSVGSRLKERKRNQK